MRPVDLAREHGLSAQAIRNYEDAGILPPSGRSAAGHRNYTPLHAQALRAFLSLRQAHGHHQAAGILISCRQGDIDAAGRIIDAGHAALLAERRTRGEVAEAIVGLSAVTTGDVSGRRLTVGEMGRRLGLHPATVRTWESAGILVPTRDAGTGYRNYDPDNVRDAEIAVQLRRGGYGLQQVAQFLRSLREAGGVEALGSFLTAWQNRLARRSRDLIAGAAQLDAYLVLIDSVNDGAVPRDD